MKGIIFEVNKKKAVALDNEGRFVNLKNKGYAVGEEVELCRHQIFGKLSYRKFASLATALVIVLIFAIGGMFGGLYYDANYKTAYTVQMNINPSVTIYLNSKDVVIKAESNNSDGTALKPNELKGETLNGFISKYIDRFVASDIYNSETDYTVKITVDGKTDATADTRAISSKVESVVREDFESKGISVATETENGIKKPSVTEPEPVEWNLIYCNKLLSDSKLITETLTDGDIIAKFADPSAEDSGYTFAFWWNMETYESDLKKPVDFFGSGDKFIKADTVLCAVWTFNGGYTLDGIGWLIMPDYIEVTLVLVYPNDPKVTEKPSEVLSTVRLTSANELVKSMETLQADFADKFKGAGFYYGNYQFKGWNYAADGSQTYFDADKLELKKNLTLYTVFEAK